MPTVNVFRAAGKALEIDTSKERQEVYKIVHAKLSKWTDSTLTDRPLSERSEMLLGLRPYPKREKKPEDKKEEKKDEKKVEKPSKSEDKPKSSMGYGEMAIAVGLVAYVGYLVFKAHKK